MPVQQDRMVSQILWPVDLSPRQQDQQWATGRFTDLAAPMARQARERGVFFHGFGDNQAIGH